MEKLTRYTNALFRTFKQVDASLELWLTFIEPLKAISKSVAAIFFICQKICFKY